MSAEFLVVTTTTADLDQGRNLARLLVESRLAACVQILPVESVYRWQDTIETTPECLLLCKTAAADYADIEDMILSNHA